MARLRCELQGSDAGTLQSVTGVFARQFEKVRAAFASLPISFVVNDGLFYLIAIIEDTSTLTGHTNKAGAESNLGAGLAIHD